MAEGPRGRGCGSMFVRALEEGRARRARARSWVRRPSEEWSSGQQLQPSETPDRGEERLAPRPPRGEVQAEPARRTGHAPGQRDEPPADGRHVTVDDFRGTEI